MDIADVDVELPCAMLEETGPLDDATPVDVPCARLEVPPFEVPEAGTVVNSL